MTDQQGRTCKVNPSDLVKKKLYSKVINQAFSPFLQVPKNPPFCQLFNFLLCPLNYSQHHV